MQVKGNNGTWANYDLVTSAHIKSLYQHPISLPSDIKESKMFITTLPVPTTTLHHLQHQSHTMA
jgi:hypothetical protein